MAPLYPWQAQYRLKRLQAVDYDLEIAPHPEVRWSFRGAGHILGSAIAEVWAGSPQRKPMFSGDLAEPARPLVRDPTPVTACD